MNDYYQIISELLYMKHEFTEFSPHSDTINKTIKLLEREKPRPVRLTTYTIRCPKCNKQITSKGCLKKDIRFCWRCGQAVSWE